MPDSKMNKSLSIFLHYSRKYNWYAIISMTHTLIGPAAEGRGNKLWWCLEKYCDQNLNKTNYVMLNSEMNSYSTVCRYISRRWKK